jgi:mono/diheme cytochrome c family protein
MKLIVFVPLLATLPLTASAADAKAGQVLVAKQCTACHISQVGGDGSSIYTRRDSIIHSMADLRERIGMCSSQIKGALTPAQEDDIAAYLNQRFYKFKTTK